MSKRATLTVGLVLLAGLPVLAINTRFTSFSPLTSSAPALPVDGPDESTPITLANSKWSQRTVADRRTQNRDCAWVQLRQLGHDHGERDRA